MEYPILMADIINSRQKDSKELMKEFKEVVSLVNKKNEDSFISPLTITLGDEFQGIIDTMENGIKTIFEIEETILGFQYDVKLRYVLFYGKIETTLNRKIAYEMLGEGLTKTRSMLNELKMDNARFFIKLNNESQKKETYLNKSFLLYQNFIDSWKTKDIKTVNNFLKYEDYKIVAEKIKVDKSSAWRRKRSLNIEEYNNIKEIILYILNTNKI
jgi:hypothetical protein